jgi:hypothetical protein
MDFIEVFLKYTEELESPTSYLKWAAITTLAAVCRDNIYFEDAYGKIYPNIYTIIVARSSATRKDPPIRIAEKLIRDVGNTKVISGRTSIQAAIRILADSFVNDKGIRLKGASGVLVSKELSDFLVEDPQAMKILTDWYDCHEVWPNSLVSLNGVLALYNVCITLLAASNDVLFRDVFKTSEVYGGLLARTFIIQESRRRQKNSRMYSNKDLSDWYKLLLEHLQLLARIKSPVRFTEPAKETYHKWYLSLEDERFDKAGVIARIHTGVLKLSMLLAAARPEFVESLEVKKEDVEASISECFDLLKNYQMVVYSAGKSEMSQPITLVLMELLKEKDHTLSRRAIIQRLFGQIDSKSLDLVKENLLDAGYIKIVQRGGEAYQLTDKFLEIYLQEKSSLLGG